MPCCTSGAVAREEEPRPRLVEAALAHAAVGHRVFPIAPREKCPPLWKGWSQCASDNRESIVTAWGANPDANIGVATGRGLVVLDADTAGAAQDLRELTGAIETPTVRTTRGLHFYFRGSARSAVSLLPGVDVRGEGGYVLGAGSVHPTGSLYRWEISPAEANVADLPRAIGALLKPPRPKPEHAGLGTSAPIPHGTRNSTLTRAAGWLCRAGLPLETIAHALRTENQARCTPPLPAREVDKILHSVASWDAAPPWQTGPMEFFDDERLSATQRHVLRVLADHANDVGECYPSVRRIAQLTGLATGTVTAATRDLERQGRISMTRGGRHKSNRYRILRYDQPLAGDGGSYVLATGTKAAA